MVSVFEHMVRQHVDFLRGGAVRYSRFEDVEKIPDSSIVRDYAEAYGLVITQKAGSRKYGFDDAKTGAVFLDVSIGASNYTNLFREMRKFIAKQRKAKSK